MGGEILSTSAVRREAPDVRCLHRKSVTLRLPFHGGFADRTPYDKSWNAAGIVCHLYEVRHQFFRGQRCFAVDAYLLIDHRGEGN